jgi:transposase
VEWLPGYAPELNAVEQVWGHTKYGDLAHHTPESLDEMGDAVEGSLSATSTEQSLLQGFVRALGLAH